ncbi:MAG TPA: OB-fold nucleic acid binding domain-containing protein, partial [Candidatus Limnocylindria bacterium]|nr:OB-fold nucleic acid binding domain-containing protein [Candidatus Limnocylindria bacterium]
MSALEGNPLRTHLHMEDTNSLIEQRRTKLAALAAKGINPFMNKFTPAVGGGEAGPKLDLAAQCGLVRAELEKWSEWNKLPEPKGPAVGLPEGTRVKLAGRISAHREMGKSHFLDIKDVSGKIQILAQKQALGEEAFALLGQLDLADFIGVEGTLFVTRMGEPSV